MQRPLTLFAAVSLLCAAGCRGDRHTSDTSDVSDDTGSLPVEDLDPDVPPVTDGSWLRPGLATSWQWQLQGPLDTSLEADLYDVDLFDTSLTTVSILHTNGHHVLCQIAVGTREAWRPDAADLPTSVQGGPVSGFDDEVWLDVRDPAVHAVMLARLDLAVQRGCDGVALDHVDVHLVDSGFAITRDDALAYARFLFNEAHERGLSVAHQDAADFVADLVDYADLAIVQRCHELDRCDLWAPFLAAGKPILNAEYAAQFVAEPKPFCVQAIVDGTRSLILAEALDNSVRVSCDTDFPTSTSLSGVQTYAVYYGLDDAATAALAGLDLAIVQPVLTADQRMSLQATTTVAAYLSIGEIGLSNSYVVDGERVVGQVVLDAHPEWFLGKNPSFDSWFADANHAGWQDFVLDQAATLIDGESYDGLFLDTVDTVDVYPKTIDGMVATIASLRAAHPDAILVQNRGMNIIGASGPSVDALMFEVFSTGYDVDAQTYVETDRRAPGYREIVEKAVAYRLDGGVVLAQDFAVPDEGFDPLICGAQERAFAHLFVPSYADRSFQDGRVPWPVACPWPDTPRLGLSFLPSLAHVVAGGSAVLTVSYAGEAGFIEPVSLSVGPFPPRVLATLSDIRIRSGQTVELTVNGGPSLEVGTTVLPLKAATPRATRDYRLHVVSHGETVWVTNAGLSNVVAFDEPTQLPTAAVPSRRTGGVVSQPYAIAVDDAGTQWVVENVGNPKATQPAGRVLLYDRFALDTPATVVDVGLTYPTGIALSDEGTAWIANSALDWSGTPRDTPDIATITPGDTFASRAFTYAHETYGYPQQLAFAPSGDLFVTTTYGLVLGFTVPSKKAKKALEPAWVISGAPGAFDVVRGIAFDGSGDLWLSGAWQGASRVVALPADSWQVDDQIEDADLSVLLTDDLHVPWGLAFDASGALWVVNRTDADDGPGSLVRFAAPVSGAMADRRIVLASRYTLGMAIGVP